MSSRIENLGDYNEARKAVQAAGGSLEKLYKQVGDTAVAKEAPALMMKGGLYGVGIVASLYTLYRVGKKAVLFFKERKQLLAEEPTLRKEFEQTIKEACDETSETEQADIGAISQPQELYDETGDLNKTASEHISEQ